MQLLEAAEEQPLHLSPEEQAEYQRRAKEYSRRSMQAHRQWQKVQLLPMPAMAYGRPLLF